MWTSPLIGVPNGVPNGVPKHRVHRAQRAGQQGSRTAGQQGTGDYLAIRHVQIRPWLSPWRPRPRPHPMPPSPRLPIGPGHRQHRGRAPTPTGRIAAVHLDGSPASGTAGTDPLAVSAQQSPESRVQPDPPPLSTAPTPTNTDPVPEACLGGCPVINFQTVYIGHLAISATPVDAKVQSLSLWSSNVHVYSSCTVGCLAR